MPKGKPIDPALKSEIVSKIRNDGMTVSAASAHYGVNSKSIYYWLRDGVVDGNRHLILENNKLKKELEQAYRVLGRLTAETRSRVIGIYPGMTDTDLAQKPPGGALPKSKHAMIDPKILADYIVYTQQLLRTIEVSDIILDRKKHS